MKHISEGNKMNQVMVDIHRLTWNRVNNKSGTTLLILSPCEYHDDFQNLEFDNVFLCSTHFEQSSIIGKVFCIKMRAGNESELLGRLCKTGIKLNAVINLYNQFGEDCTQSTFFYKMMPLFADKILYFSNRNFFTKGNLDAPFSLESVALPDFVELLQKHSNSLEENITGWCIKKTNTIPTSVKFSHVELVLHRESVWSKVNHFDAIFMKQPRDPMDSREGWNSRSGAISNYLHGFGVSDRKVTYFSNEKELLHSFLPLLEKANEQKLESVACIPFSGGGYENIHEQLKNWTSEFPKEIHVFHLHKDDFDYFYKLPEAVITAPRMSKYEMLQFIEKSETQGKSKIEAVN